ncbi:hypothetical protein [Halomonas organivorans]|uniref:Uncharacterized protein n=1 Tax=Halomonas organivorans TaxID=257772 RepID=A0A7W5BWY5_9GAMM|nr:hypothetical protein [Halomonas organivorans]MBB3140681.1 hypothetical protein [Halomonas organivorans]
MLKKLFGKPPIRLWVIKQVDPDLLHLCGEGRITPADRRDTQATMSALRRGDYRGAVEMTDNGVVLNARLFAALVPHGELSLGASGHAEWRGHSWRVAQVPQRCWTYEGRLVAEPTTLGPLDLVSSEDVSGIRRRACAEDAPSTGDPRFGAADELEGEAEFAARWRRDARDPEQRHDDS